MCFPQTSIWLNTLFFLMFQQFLWFFYRHNSRLEGLKLLCGVQSWEHLWRSIKCINVWVLRVENRIRFPKVTEIHSPSWKSICWHALQHLTLRNHLVQQKKFFHVNDFLSSLSNLGLCYFHFFPHQHLPQHTTGSTVRHYAIWHYESTLYPSSSVVKYQVVCRETYISDRFILV